MSNLSKEICECINVDVKKVVIIIEYGEYDVGFISLVRM